MIQETVSSQFLENAVGHAINCENIVVLVYSVKVFSKTL